MIAILFICVFQFCWNTSLLPDAVPDEETALRIAEAVLVLVYGEDVLSQPFNVTFDASKNVWVVTGTLPEGWDGGVPEIVIRKRDSMIMAVSHSK